MEILPIALLAITQCEGATAADSTHDRAAALVRQMSLQEKISQMGDQAPAIPRLHIPAYGWWNEALHGVARNGLATVFPQAIGRAASWDTDLERRVADVISTEARAKFNLKGDRADHKRYDGLTFWSPNINIFRDPRWGRGQETFGEDPYLTGEIAKQFIDGMQGNDARFFKTIATAKHFAAHSGPETGRHGFDATVSEVDLDDTYLRAFRTTLTKGAYSVMCAYNRINGAPACANTDLLDTRLRKGWGFRGYVVSDCGAVDDIYSGHHYTASLAEAAAKAVKAGTDLSCGNEYRHLNEAVDKKLITEADIDRSVTRLLEARIRLGLFESRDPYSGIGVGEIASPTHARVALEAAEKSMVLLKNNGQLPWTRVPKKIAVIGPAADDPDTLLGNYYGTPSHLISPLVGLRAQFGATAKIEFAQGSLYADGMTALVPETNLPEGLKARYTVSNAAVLSRTEPRLYFHREMDTQAKKVLGNQPFSVVWEGTLRPSYSGIYALGLAHQECDSCPGNVTGKLFVDGKEIVEDARKAATGASAKSASLRLDADRSYAIRIEYVQSEGGSGIELVWSPPPQPMLEEAGELAANSDATVLCLGLNSRLEGEELRMNIPGFAGGDRTSLDLPAEQTRLLEAVLAAGKPLIVVLLNGSAIAMDRSTIERFDALLEAWYPGQEGGTAIARTIAGDNNPAGRLPVTFYKSIDQLPPFADYSMKGRTYRYFNGEPLFRFGFGLSYSTFRYQVLNGNAATAKVTNTSGIDGDEVAQLYIPIEGGHWQLEGFQRLHLRAGESKTVTFSLPKSAGWQIAGASPTNRP